MEGHAHASPKTERRKNNEGFLLSDPIEQHLVIPNYYGQWQKIQAHPLMWQNQPEQVKHEGRRWIADYVKKTSKSILDVGCGIGLDYEHYRDSEIRYLGVDITPKFVEAAHQRGVPAELGDVKNLRFKDGSFDTVYCKDLLIHLLPGDWRVALREMVRVARLQVITLEDDWYGMTEYSLREKHASFNKEAHEFEMLWFYHNVYSESEFLKFATTLGLTVQVHHTNLKTPILSADRTIRTSQITVYTKEQG